ncbi:hypothetical protein K7X08_030445 [Anisodus acutangulus]|uniref:Acyl-CoA dehydrogenase n=1 Tax=Anisodus acutangulus TaxID=402998 RepID=A0A9Q1L755_9SOLA|nr:hypothetical protein K7X08_030445 [Anisodus acutangulus]
MVSRTSDIVGGVDPAQSFDKEALLRYGSANVVGFPTNPSQFTLSQFGHGQSNPTFLIEVLSGTLTKKYVLRKKAHGNLLASAHAVEREYEVLHELSTHTVVPVPKIFCLCTDSSVIGTPFYIMEYLEGRIFIDPKLPDVCFERRRVIYRDVAQALVVLHSVYVDIVGLGNYGKRTDYCKRQVGQTISLSTGEGKSMRNPKMLELADWLRKHIPLEDSSRETTGLVHGDFQIDNVVFHSIEDRVIGILDWELSTLGNQMCDVAYSCLGYIVNIASESIEENNGFELTSYPDVVPSLSNYLRDYCSAAGRPWPVDQWKFYIAFSLFRGASIYARVHCRWIMGNASGGERARCAGEKADSFIRTAWSFIHRKYPKSRNASGGKFVPSEKVQKLRNKLTKFMEDHIYPKENEFYKLAQSTIVLLRYGNEVQMKEWLVPLLEGKIRSGFAMTEPHVASSDATNIECSIKRHGDSYIINGTKWWISGAMDPRCKILIVMGKTDLAAPKHKQQSIILVDINSPGITVKRPLTVFGFDDAPHGHTEIIFENVCVPAKNILLGEGRGFEIAQGRLGPGRLHHCMRLIGAADRGMQMMVQRALQRKAFGKLIAQHGSFLSDVARCRIDLEKTRLLVLEVADQLDRLENKKARGTIAMAKVAAPNMALKVLDTAMQVHGGAGLSVDTVLAHLWATARTLRIADGPDEVHLGTIAKMELQRARL